MNIILYLLFYQKWQITWTKYLKTFGVQISHLLLRKGKIITLFDFFNARLACMPHWLYVLLALFFHF